MSTRKLDLFHWLDLPEVNSQCLTVADIARLKPGDRLQTVVLDRNISDTVSLTVRANRMYKPKKALWNARGTYVHKEGLTGTMILEYQNKKIVLDPFVFEVEYKPRHWAPLKLFKKKWDQWPATTHLGFRGPILKWRALASLPRFNLASTQKRNSNKT
jgi:hypothetical protein